MSTKFNNKYRIDSTRLKTWDYANSAAYFITICTANREHYFGEISKGQMHTTPLGKIVEEEWLKTISLRPDMNLSLGEYIVMPNHFHAIIFIGRNKYNTSIPRTDAMHGVSEISQSEISRSEISQSEISQSEISPIAIDSISHSSTDAMHGVSIAMDCASTEIPQLEIPSNSRTDAKHGVSTKTPLNQFGPQAKNLASIIRGFKSAVTTYARKNNQPFAWQASYHDHIIRNAAAYDRIANYINNNPSQWKEDKFF